jgi:hypothetical protein
MTAFYRYTISAHSHARHLDVLETYRKTRSATGVTEKGRLTSTLTLTPSERFKLWELLTLRYQVFDGEKWDLLSITNCR